MIILLEYAHTRTHNISGSGAGPSRAEPSSLTLLNNITTTTITTSTTAVVAAVVASSKWNANTTRLDKYTSTLAHL